MNPMTNHHGINLSEFRAGAAGAAGATAVCLVQSLLMQGMIQRAERDLGDMHREQRREQAVRLAAERNRERA